MRARRSIEISTRGGCSETDMNAFAVMPCTCSPTRVVRIVTPVANIPSVRRKASDGSSGRSPTSICSEIGTSSKAESPSPESAPGANPGRTRSNSSGGGASVLMLRFCRTGEAPRMSRPRRS